MTTSSSIQTAGRIGPVFFAHAAAFPDKPAIICGARSINYGDLAQLVVRWSHGMAVQGVARGDLIGVILPNNIEFVALMLVAAELGAGLVPLSTGLTPAAVERAFQAAQVGHIVSTGQLLAPLIDAPGLAAINGVWLSIDTPQGRATTLEQMLHGMPAAAPLHRGCEDDALILTMTSGSTGDPKPIVLTQRTKFNRVSAAAELYGIVAADRTLAATPLYHSLAERLVLIPLLTGGTSVLMSNFSPINWLQCVQQQQVSFSIAVSSQLKQINAHMAQDGSHDMSSLRCIVSSSALLEPHDKAELLSRFDCDFHECYGASEIAIASNLDSDGARHRQQSVGRAAPGVDIIILDEQGQVLGPEQVGEIACRTSMLFGGYFQRPELTAVAMAGDYFRTGDLGRLDADGYLFFMGRLKDLIISGGINIYPHDIEAAIASHGCIKESAAFALPDERLGEIVAVALVPNDPATFALRALRFHCAEMLADFQQPRKFFIVDRLPRNPMGKLMKFQLVKTYST